VDVYAYFEEQIPKVNRALDELIPAADTEPVQLHAAMRHILFPGGKRLRPVLAMAAAEAVGSPGERALPLAAAAELVHTYSLVHDDLPCMDDDAERRGVPAVHVAFGEAVAVLAGDALLAAAFEVLAAGSRDLTPESVVAASLELSRAAGSLALVGGQAEDLVFDASDTNAARIESVHACKSAALIAASIVGGALLGGAESRFRSPTTYWTRERTTRARWFARSASTRHASAPRNSWRRRSSNSKTWAKKRNRCVSWCDFRCGGRYERGNAAGGNSGAG